MARISAIPASARRWPGGQLKFDFSVTKMTRMGENQSIQFRTELPAGTVGNQSLYGSNAANIANPAYFGYPLDGGRFVRRRNPL